MITEETTLAELGTILDKASISIEGCTVVGNVAIVRLVGLNGYRHQYRGNTLAQALSRAYNAYVGDKAKPVLRIVK